MLTIVATVCLLYSNPHKCKEIHLSFQEEAPSALACMSPMPLAELAKWLESAPKNPDGSPKWYLKRYKCMATADVGQDI